MAIDQTLQALMAEMESAGLTPRQVHEMVEQRYKAAASVSIDTEVANAVPKLSAEQWAALRGLLTARRSRASSPMTIEEALRSLGRAVRADDPNAGMVGLVRLAVACRDQLLHLDSVFDGGSPDRTSI